MWNSYSTCRYYASMQCVAHHSRSELKNTPSYKIVILDLDGTLVTSSNAKRYADNDPTNWVYLGPIPEQLQHLWSDGWTIAIMTNQSRFNNNVAARIENIRQDLENRNGWSPFIFIATTNDIFRKPQAGMISLLIELLRTDLSHIESIFVCGDGVGLTDSYPPYRWTSADYDLATSLGIMFIRPLALFGTNFENVVGRSQQEMIILVGNAGSGKSTIASHLAHQNYIICSGDTLNTQSKMLQTLRTNLELGRSVVIDATNPSADKRALYINPAKELNISVRILWLIRDGRPWNNLRASPVPEVAYGVYSKNFVRPSTNEASVEIIY
jgi:bifunctional polynucleotide phosphatase/kinase